MGVGEKTCPVTIITWMSVTIARPNIIAGLPRKNPSRLYVYFLQMVYEETVAVLKETLVDLILGRKRPRILTIVTKITGKFILGLDILRAYNMTTDLKHHVLQLGEKEVSLLCIGDRPRSFLLTMVSDEVILARCERGNCTAGGFTGGDEQPRGI
jgi:hypothetical protein